MVAHKSFNRSTKPEYSKKDVEEILPALKIKKKSDMILHRLTPHLPPSRRSLFEDGVYFEKIYLVESLFRGIWKGVSYLGICNMSKGIMICIFIIKIIIMIGLLLSSWSKNHSDIKIVCTIIITEVGF